MSDTLMPGESSASSTASPAGVTPELATDFVRSRFDPKASTAAPVVQGEWSRAFAFDASGAKYIVRFSALDEDFQKDRLAARFASADLPIPRVFEIGRAFGGFYAISERAPGEFLDSADGPRMRCLLPALFAALDAARQADLSATSGFGGWGADGSARFPTWPAALLDVASDPTEGRTHGWRARLAASPTGLGPFETAFAAFRGLLDYLPGDRHLIHSDLLNHNVLASGDQLTAVFDWGCALYGDFLYDIAWFTFWAPWYPAWHEIDFAREAAQHYASIGLEVRGFARRLRCYELHIGLAHLAYNAYRGRWKDLADVTRWTLELAGRDIEQTGEA